MKYVELDLTDPELLESAMQQHLAYGVCPGSHLPPPAPLEDVEIQVALPKGQFARWQGRAIRNMGPGSFLVELAPAPNLAWLGSLLIPDEFPEEKTPVEHSEEFHAEEFPDGPEPIATDGGELALEDAAGLDSLDAPPSSEFEAFESEDTPPSSEFESLDSLDAPPSAELAALNALDSLDAPPVNPEMEGEALADAVAPVGRTYSAGITGMESEFSDLYRRIGELPMHEKRQLARQGGKTARGLLVKDSNKTLHMFVMMNPKISLEEIEEYSKLPSLSAEAIRHMVKNRTWMASRSVIFNLVRNPATPIDIAVMLVAKLGTSEWRAITNSSTIRSPIAAAARKLLFK